ncbi:MAG: prepilin-type cleavage/methylation domain-containing protein, partial [Polyangiaceae bacterium]
GTCGCEGFCTGAVASPVVRMLYDLRTIDTGIYPQYAGLYARSGHAETAFHRGPNEARRTELVRVELDQAGAEIPASLEVLAEFAVDLKFGITRDTAAAGLPPNLLREPVAGPNVYTTANLLSNGGTPDRIRGVQVRFGARAHRRDREIGLAPIGADGGLLRYGLGADQGFVRMRTLVTDVQLPNQQRPIL